MSNSPIIRSQVVDNKYIHNCFSSMFSGMLNWFDDELNPRFHYKVISTYDKAVSFFNNKLRSPDGAVQTSILPAITLDPILDFSNEEKAGRFLWQFKHLDSLSQRIFTKGINLRDQGVVVTPMFSRYQGTCEVTFWFTSIYDLMDFRVNLLQNCGGYQRWIRPKFFWTHMIFPKELIEFKRHDGEVLEWSNTDTDLIQLSTTNSKEYAYPFPLDAIWRLDGLADASTKYGADQVCEFKMTGTFTWECSIPTYYRIDNYQFNDTKFELNISMANTVINQPILKTIELVKRMTDQDIINKMLKTSIYSIAEDTNPVIKISATDCENLPKIYQLWNHYRSGKMIYLSDTFTDFDSIDRETILVIDLYKPEYISYIRKCNGVISKNDNSCGELYRLCINDRKDLICNIQNDDLFAAIISLDGTVVTLDPISRFIYNKKVLTQIVTKDSQYGLDIVSNNLIDYLNNTGTVLGKPDYTLQTETLTTNIYADDLKYAAQKISTGNFTIPLVVYDSNMVDVYSGSDILSKNMYSINTSTLTITDSQYADSNNIYLKMRMMCETTTLSSTINYIITKQDEINYYTDSKNIDISLEAFNINSNTSIAVCSYPGLLEPNKEYVVDIDNKKIIMNIIPVRDKVIQVFI